MVIEIRPEITWSEAWERTDYKEYRSFWSDENVLHLD
jgi:hypothetical protein